MRAVLDTGVLYHPSLLDALSREAVLVLPAVAFVERVRQLRRDHRDVDAFVARLFAADIEVESFGVREALGVSAITDEAWDEHARDAMIAAHVREGDVLWTTNPKDFAKLGLRPDQIRGV
ncbi:MAG TPA: PIN domain-containing protein [Candidatus Thermoplasmatota archaeon]|nr:PIN domain-containing protein [Candidatus Thermoplasmatota archaeon]